MRLGHLRCFFDRIIEWGYHDAPARTPVFAGDIPIRDRPLPRFLDDPDATKLLSAARRLPTLFDRVCVEVLARTGLRKGEFLGLTTDAVVTAGQVSAYDPICRSRYDLTCRSRGLIRLFTIAGVVVV